MRGLTSRARRAVAAFVAVTGVIVALVAANWLPEGEFVLGPLALATVLAATALGGWQTGLLAVGAVGIGRLVGFDTGETIGIDDGRELLAPLYLVVGGLTIVLLAERLRGARRHADHALRRLERLALLDHDLSLLDSLEQAIGQVPAAVATATGARAAELRRSPPPASESDRADQPYVLALPTVGAEPWHLELALGHPADRDERAFLEAVARRAGQTLERLALREAERRARSDEQLVSEAAALLSETLDVDEVVERLRTLVVPSFADACEVELDGPEAETAESDRELRIALRSRDRRIGTLTVRRSQRGFDEHDRAIARQLASRGAQALDNALLFDAQSRVRTTLERSLLPLALLPVDNLALAARYFPGSLGSDVGGDFYDAVRRPDGSTVLIIGDVQGKGVEAAGMTAVARHTLRSTALEGANPATMLAQLNQALLYGHAELAVARDEDPRFVTAAVVAIERSEGGFMATGATAGHPPPLVVRADGTTEYLPVGGPLLGFFDTPAFPESSTALAERDTIVLYTDGVTELRHGSEWFDDVELGRLLHNRRAPVDAEAIAQLIEDTVLVITGGTVRDDIAILVASVV